MNKYYNLTKIENGWFLKYLNMEKSPSIKEMFFKTLGETLQFIGEVEVIEELKADV